MSAAGIIFSKNRVYIADILKNPHLVMLYKLEKNTFKLVETNEQIIALSEEFRRKYP